jgi:hypothetical protein
MARKPNDVAGVFEKNPGSGIWYVRYRPHGQNPVRKMIGARSDAIDHLRKVQLIKHTGEGVIAKSLVPYRQRSAARSSRAPRLLVRSGADTAICSKPLAR